MTEVIDNLYVLDWTTDVWKLLVRLLFAIVAGFLFGYENKRRSKDAGIKTHTMLCMTACLIMIISKYGFYELSKYEGIQYDASRVASTILSGLGFLGAGMVFYKQDSIKGLTSAVGMCLTISVGMCFGSGLIVIGCVMTVVSLFLQHILHSDFGIFKNNKQIVVRAVFEIEDNYVEHFKSIFNIKDFLSFKIKRENDKEIADVEFYYSVKNNAEELVEIAKSEKNILLIEKY